MNVDQQGEVGLALPGELEGTVRERLERAEAESVARRVWERDPALWGGGADTPELSDRLGWLDVAERMRGELDELRAFARECAADGLRDAVLLGMGGSSLAPEVFRQSFGSAGDHLRLHVLDSTDPAAVLDAERAIDLEHTLFVVSSKSGSTIETLSQFRHFHERVEQGDRFVAVTDPGSPLAELAAEHGFRRTFLADPEIGGRYSALSHFGMVPAALIGADLDALVDGARDAAAACSAEGPAERNPGLRLGCALGELARRGRDKATFVVDDPEIASIGLWLEQLVAESTGKRHTGILPVAGEPVGDPGDYGEDRVFVHLRGDGASLDERVGALGAAGHPVLTIPSAGARDLGRIFFLAEFATAVAGWALEINPFDQPNVQEAKDNTKKVLAGGDLPSVPESLDDSLAVLLGQAAPPAYVAIMAYVEPAESFDQAIEELRTTIRRLTRATTTFGYGPRFLHSTGQFHKGGPPVGRFLQLVGAHDGEDADIPGEDYGFRHLIEAQAIGDLQTLEAHELPVARVRLGDDAVASVREIRQAIEEMRC